MLLCLVGNTWALSPILSFSLWLFVHMKMFFFVNKYSITGKSMAFKLLLDVLAGIIITTLLCVLSFIKCWHTSLHFWLPKGGVIAVDTVLINTVICLRLHYVMLYVHTLPTSAKLNQTWPFFASTSLSGALMFVFMGHIASKKKKCVRVERKLKIVFLQRKSGGERLTDHHEDPKIQQFLHTVKNNKYHASPGDWVTAVI